VQEFVPPLFAVGREFVSPPSVAKRLSAVGQEVVPLFAVKRGSAPPLFAVEQELVPPLFAVEQEFAPLPSVAKRLSAVVQGVVPLSAGNWLSAVGQKLV
jgi:hypothetical protein